MYGRTQRLFKPVTVCLLLVFIFTSPAFAAGKSDVRRIKKLVVSIETGTMRPLSSDKLKAKLESSRKKLIKYLSSNPDDVEALILSARLGQIYSLDQPVVMGRDRPDPDPKKKFVMEFANLDRAIQLQPSNASAHYWKARLYGVSIPGTSSRGEFTMQEIDLAKAIVFVRRAVKLDPANVQYREALAIYLVSDGKRDQALDAMNIEAAAKSPVRVLLEQINAVPFPKGTQLSKWHSDVFGDQQVHRGRISNYTNLRVFVFVVPMSAAHIEAFYKKKWPNFKYFGVRRTGSLSQQMQYFLFKNGQWVTVSEKKMKTFRGAPNGMLISILENNAPNKKQRDGHLRGTSYAKSKLKVYSLISYVNYRSTQ